MVRRVRRRPGFVGRRRRDGTRTERKGRPATAGHNQGPRCAGRRSVTGARRCDPRRADRMGHRHTLRMRIGSRPGRSRRPGATTTSRTTCSNPSSGAAHPTPDRFLPESASPDRARDDIASTLSDASSARLAAAGRRLSQISHPDLATPECYERYDHVFVASDPFAARMAERAAVPVTPLRQAAIRSDSGPCPGAAPRASVRRQPRRVHRQIVDDPANTSRDLAIYGSNSRLIWSSSAS